MSKITRDDIEEILPLLPGQESPFARLSETGRSIVLERRVWRLSGGLDAERLERSVRRLMARESVLRTVFFMARKQPVQIILKAPPELQLEVHDLRSTEEGAAKLERDRILAEDLERPVEVFQGPLWRVALLRLSDAEALMVFTWHALLLDERSAHLLIADLAGIYEALGEGAESVPPDRASLKDFVVWRKQQPPEEALDFWEYYLQDFERSTPLPADHHPSEDDGGGRALWCGRLDPETAAALAERAGQMGTTAGVLAQAAWAMVLSRFSNEKDVVFGLTATGRGIDLAGVDQMIGPLANRLPVRVEIDRATPLDELLHTLTQHELNLGHSGHVSAEAIQSRSSVEPPRGLYDSLLTMHEARPVGAGSSLAFRPEVGLASSTLEDVSLEAKVFLGEGGWLQLNYRKGALDGAIVEAMGNAFQNLLVSMIKAHDEAPLSRLEMLSSAQRKELRAELDRTAEGRGFETLTPELLASRASERPEAVALRCGEASLSYAELHQRADRLSHWLHRQGVARGSLVGVFGERGLGMSVTILGIVKAGAAWVPLDPSHPDDRLARILTDSSPGVVATQGRLAYRLWQMSQSLENPPEVFCWDSAPGGSDLVDAGQLGTEPVSPLPLDTEPHDLAYVFYTSGSTGLPKGAMVHHQGMVNHLWAKIDLLRLDPESVVVQNAAHGFDIFVWQLLAPLMVGGRVEIYAGDAALDPARLLSGTERDTVTVLEVVPSMLNALLEHVEELRQAGRAPRLPALEFLLSTGEALPVPVARRWFEAFEGVPMVNAFGPTECSDDTLHHLMAEAPPAAASRVPVGRPVPGFAVYVLDRDLGVLPRGCPGQIGMAGVGVGHGYLGAPVKTAGVFVPDDLTGSAGSRIYLSGDLGRLGPDGAIEFLGRIDSQVKVRGHRIELGEVESALARHPDVREAAVLPLAELESYRLVAFYVARGQLDAGRLRAFLEDLLTSAMVPEQLVQIDAMPLNRSGKIDRSALRQEVLPQVPGRADRQQLVPPRDETERLIAEIWGELLDLPEISVTDNFFELGGHSLMAVQVRSRINHRLGLDLELRTVLESPRLEELAAEVKALADRSWVRDEAGDRIPSLPVSEHYPLSYAQRLLWFQQQLNPADTSFNLPEIYSIEGALDLKALERSLEALVERHESLRTVFAIVDGEPVQKILPRVPVALEHSDVSQLEGRKQEIAIHALHREVIPEVFDLEVAPWRARLVRVAPERHLLILVVHHLVTDQMSFGVMMGDLRTLYRSLAAGQDPHLPPIPIRYVDYAAWQGERIRGGGLLESEKYWMEKLSGHLPTLELPGRLARPKRDAGRGTRTVSVPVDEDAVLKLRTLGKELDTTFFTTLLAVANAFLSRVTGQTDLIQGTPIANRDRADTEGVVGFFADMLPLRTDLSGDPSFSEILGRTRRTTVEAFEHADYPFELVVQRLNPERELDRQPVFSTTFVLVEAQEKTGQPLADSLDLRPQPRYDDVETAYDFNLMFYETEESLQCAIGYRAALFEERHMRRLIQRFRRLIEGIAADPEQRLSNLPILSQEERRQLQLRPLPRSEQHSLSIFQQETWLEIQNTPKSTAHHQSLAVDLEGTLDVGVLKNAVQAVFDAHGVLRTTFGVVDGRPVQKVSAKAEPIWVEEDFRELEGSRLRARLEAWRAGTSEVLFDLETGPLSCFALARIGDSKHRLLLVAHRLILDDRGLAELLRQVFQAYRRRLSGDAEIAPRPTLQYTDFAEWQQARLEAHLLASERAYWRQQLEVALPGFELPADLQAPRLPGFATGRVELRLQADQLERLVESASVADPFRGVVALQALLFHRLTGEHDLTMAVPVSFRQEKLAGTLGLYSSHWPLRVVCDGTESFGELLRGVDRTLDEMAQRGGDSFYEVLADLAVQRDRSRPLMPIAIVRAPEVEESAGGVSAVSCPPRIRESLFDLQISVYARGRDVRVVFFYQRELFEHHTVEQLAESLGALLGQAVARPRAAVSELGILSEPQRLQALSVDSVPRSSQEGWLSIHELFERQVELRPMAIAARCAARELTYQELDARAAGIARWLSERNVSSEDRVALWGDRGLGMLATILGILKAGAAFVPLDPKHPDERLRRILRSVEPAVVATRTGLAERSRDLVGSLGLSSGILCWDGSLETLGPVNGGHPEDGLEGFMAGSDERCPVERDRLACIFHTSGSTGQPKGAMVAHGGLMNHVRAKVDILELDERSVVVQNASHCFDISVWQYLAALAVGGRVEIFPEETALDARETLAAAAGSGVTVLETVPSFLSAMLEVPGGSDLPHLLYLVSNAETLPVTVARRWFERFPHVALLNTFGATECSDDTTHHVMRQSPSSKALRVPVGRQIQGTRHLLLDERLRPVPAGFAGLLAVEGIAVGRGYWRDPRRTALAFIPSPVAAQAGGRIYMTGDLGRWNHEGLLEFVGRRDHQIKIRGFRVELGEIEAALYRHPQVAVAAVVQCEVDPRKRPVAFVELRPGATADVSELRTFAERELPEYMVPAAFELLPVLPRTTTGKVDRKSLAKRPMPLAEVSREIHESDLPRNPTEEILTRIWADVLDLEQVGIHDGFFQLGGDSIMSIRVASLAQREGIELVARDFYQYQTVAELAAALAERTPAEEAPEPEVEVGPVPLTPMQYWFFDKRPVNPHHWNVAYMARVRVEMDPRNAGEAVRRVAERHDAFRLRFQEDSAGWRASTSGEPSPEVFQRFDLSGVPRQSTRERIEEIAAELQQSLDLASGPLMRVAFFELDPPARPRILFIFHHLVMDPVSLEVVLEDFVTACQQLERKEAVSLPPRTTSFQRWARLLETHANSEQMRHELPYWLDRLPERIKPLPVDGEDTVLTEATARSVKVALDEVETEALLRDLPAAFGTQINDALLAALVEAFGEWTGERALLVETPSHGREEIFDGVKLSRTVGWFSSGIPLWVDLRAASTPEEALLAVHEQLGSVPDRGIGYGLLRHLCHDPSVAEQLAARPRAQVTFQYDSWTQSGIPESWPLEPAPESVGPKQSPLEDPSREPVLLWIKANSLGGRLEVEWIYGEGVHQRSTIEHLASTHIANLRKLLNSCLAAGPRGAEAGTAGQVLLTGLETPVEAKASS